MGESTLLGVSEPPAVISLGVWGLAEARPPATQGNRRVKSGRLTVSPLSRWFLALSRIVADELSGFEQIALPHADCSGHPFIQPNRRYRQRRRGGWGRGSPMPRRRGRRRSRGIGEPL